MPQRKGPRRCIVAVAPQFYKPRETRCELRSRQDGLCRVHLRMSKEGRKLKMWTPES